MVTVRKQGIGSSDAAAACGLNPHMSMLELWMIKTGRMQALQINLLRTTIHLCIGGISLNH
jgi:predicted phage-related endonuclease